MRRFPLLVALLAGLGSPVQADQLADADVAGWLTRMAAAERAHSYQGTFVYERNGSFSTHGMSHDHGLCIAKVQHQCAKIFGHGLVTRICVVKTLPVVAGVKCNNAEVFR